MQMTPSVIIFPLLTDRPDGRRPPDLSVDCHFRFGFPSNDTTRRGLLQLSTVRFDRLFFFPSAKGFTFTDRGHQAGKNMADRIVFEGPHTLIITFSTVSQVPSILWSVGEKEIAGWLGFLYGSQLLERQTFLVSFSALVRFLKIPAHGRLYVG